MIPITHVGLRAMTGIKQQQQQKVTSTTHKRFNNTPENNESVPTVYPSLNRLRAKADNLIGQYKDGLEGKATLMELKYQSGMLKKKKSLQLLPIRPADRDQRRDSLRTLQTSTKIDN